MRNKKPIKPIIIVLIVYTVIFAVGLIFLLPYVQERLFYIFERNDELILPLFLTFCLGTTVCTVALAFFLQANHAKKDDVTYFSKKTVSGKQEYLEREIATLNERLVASEERWKTVYHLLLSSQNKQTDMSGIVSTARFLKGFGIDSNNITIRYNLAFVLTPFLSDFEGIYLDICEACKNVKLVAMRSDEEYIQTDILKHIIKCIVEARVVIANIDGRNANVFYELGIAHALNKPTVLVSKIDSKAPFDVQGQYVVQYASESELVRKLSDSLLKLLTSNNS